MTVRKILNLMDHEVWVRIRINDGREKNHDADLVVWSADWIGGGPEDPLMPAGLSDYLDCYADDMSIETHIDPDSESGEEVPMIVVNAYPRIRKRKVARNETSDRETA